MAKLKKPTKKKISGKKKENYNSVLLERMHDDIKLIAEGQVGLQRQFDEFKNEMTGFRKETENNFKTIFEYLSRLEEEFMEIKNDLKNNYEKKGWDKKWRESIEERLGNLENLLTKKNMRANLS